MLPANECYIEVFGGAGWVLFAKPPSRVEVFNDIDSEVVNFFEVVKKKPKELIQAFDLELVSRKRFNELRKLEPSLLSDVDRAHRFYYLIMAAWGGELGTPRFQTSISDGGHGNRLIGSIKTLRERIEPVHARISTVIIENLTWQECIARYDRPYDTHKVVMYLDPPYPGNNINYVHNMRSIKAHEELVEVLIHMESRFLLSSYDLPEVRTLYSKHGFYIESVSFAAGMPTNGSRAHKNQEIIVSNYDPSLL